MGHGIVGMGMGTIKMHIYVNIQFIIHNTMLQANTYPHPCLMYRRLCSVIVIVKAAQQHWLTAHFAIVIIFVMLMALVAMLIIAIVNMWVWVLQLLA